MAKKSIKTLERLARGGDAAAAVERALRALRLCEQYKEPPEHIKSMVYEWCKLAAQLSDWRGAGAYYYAMCFKKGWGVPVSHSYTFATMWRLAEQQDPYGYMGMYHCYAFGVGVAVDEPCAIDWLGKAFAWPPSFGFARLHMGLRLLLGKDMTQDYPLGLSYIKEAAAAGRLEAYYTLATLYLCGGHGVEQDDAEALHWLRLAAKGGKAKAMVELGLGYFHGKWGLPLNTRRALAYLKQAAVRGNIKAQYHLGMMHGSNVVGVEQSNDLMLSWVLKAARAGYAPAQYWMATLYYQGNGVPRDPEQAMDWAQKAAAQGYGTALFMLGVYAAEDRDGVKADLDEAARWFLAAKQKDHPEALNALRDVVARM